MTFRRGRPGLLLAALVHCASSCSGDADFSEAMPQPVTLSAESYRHEIAAIDRLVFEAGAFGTARRETLATTLGALAGRVKAGADSRFLAIEAFELRRLAEAAKGLNAGPAQERFAREWMRIRNNVFDDRSWFARSAADLDRPDPVTPSAR